jgi:mono/diheme cytochrome c family protein
MVKKIIFSVISLMLMFTFASVGFSEKKGNSRKGKHLYRKSCRSCHQDGATATPLGPDSKTQAQWERTFKPDNFNKLSCKDEWAKHSDAELKDIFSYLRKYAFDSPSPAKCK